MTYRNRCIGCRLRFPHRNYMTGTLAIRKAYARAVAALARARTASAVGLGKARTASAPALGKARTVAARTVKVGRARLSDAWLWLRLKYTDTDPKVYTAAVAAYVLGLIVSSLGNGHGTSTLGGTLTGIGIALGFTHYAHRNASSLKAEAAAVRKAAASRLARLKARTGRLKARTA